MLHIPFNHADVFVAPADRAPRADPRFMTLPMLAVLAVMYFLGIALAQVDSPWAAGSLLANMLFNFNYPVAMVFAYVSWGCFIAAFTRIPRISGQVLLYLAAFLGGYSILLTYSDHDTHGAMTAVPIMIVLGFTALVAIFGGPDDAKKRLGR